MAESDGVLKQAVHRMYASLIKRQLASLVFPVHCLGCDLQILSPTALPVAHGDTNHQAAACDEHWCQSCYDQIVGQRENRCGRCGANTAISNPYSQRCRLCYDLKLRFDRAFAIGNYHGLLRRTVIRMKRDQDEVLAFRLGRLLANQVDLFRLLTKIDLIVPVPTHWSRKLKRGFDGASLIAEGISSNCRIRKSDRILVCLRATRKQGTLSTAGRFNNVRGAFGLGKNANVRGLRILIVDDVMTSGATADEAAWALRKNGAAEVHVAVAARGAKVS